MHRRAAVTLTSPVVLFASHARQEVSGGQQVLDRVKCVVNVHAPAVVQGYLSGCNAYVTCCPVCFTYQTRGEWRTARLVLDRVKCVVNVHAPAVVPGYLGGVYVVFVDSRYMK